MYWLIAAVILFIIEMVVGTFYLLIICASLVSVALASYFFHTSLVINNLIAITFSILGILAVRYWQKMHKSENTESTAAQPDYGQAVILEHAISDQLWQVYYRGTYWQARFIQTETAKIGESAFIIGHQGNTLLIQRYPTNS